MHQKLKTFVISFYYPTHSAADGMCSGFLC